MKETSIKGKKELLLELIAKNVYTMNRLNRIKRRFANDRRIGMITNAALLETYRAMRKEDTVAENTALELLLKKRSIRTLSGVAPITVMTAPLGCPKNCLYCPSEKNMPKSYLSNQPAAMRAVLSDFDPITQTTTRLRALKRNGHNTDKIEIIILGGTWSAHPNSYQTWFMTKIFETCNVFDETSIVDHGYTPYDQAKKIIEEKLLKRTKVDKALYQPDDTELRKELDKQQKINEMATNRIIGVTIETRPDHITPEEVARLRMLGVTKVEIGVQTIYQDISELNRRDQQVVDIQRATKLLKDAGFKVAYHMMPGMYGSTPERDISMFKELFSNEAYKPDFLKIYPCVVVKDSDLYNMYKQGDFTPYSTEELVNVLVEVKKDIPRYTRIARLHRDIPSESIAAGCKVTNVREMIQKKLHEQNLMCACIRCHEPMKAKADPTRAVYNEEPIQAADAQEYFLTFNSPDEKYLYAFLRLRLPSASNKEVITTIPELANAAIVRELHTYGVLTPINDKGGTKAVQHMGFGRRLMAAAEERAVKNGVKKMAVIAGIGVRKYYKKLGYRLEGTFMVKDLAE